MKSPLPPKRPRDEKRPAPAFGSIRADSVYPKWSLCVALGWQQAAWISAVRAGLKTVRFGKGCFVLGGDVIKFFERLANEQAAAGDAQGSEEGSE